MRIEKLIEASLTLSRIFVPTIFPRSFHLTALFFLSIYPVIPLYSEELRTGDHLYLSKQYDLAFVEYMRLYLNGMKSPELKNRLSLACMRRDDYKHSLEYLDTNSFSSLYLRLYASLRSGFPGMAMETYLNVSKSNKFSADEKDHASLLAGTLLIERGEFENARNHYEMLLRNSENKDVRDAGKHLLGSLDEYRKKRRKSKFLAGIMSGIIPGSGQFYSGHRTDGVSAFLINGILIGSAAQLNRAETKAKMDHTSSAIVGLIALIFYSANIAGAIASAERYNLYQQRVFHQEIRERFFNLDKVEKNAGISFKTSY